MNKKIVTLPDLVLRKHAGIVSSDEFGSKKLLGIIKDMSDALRTTSDGIGIAAPQIGVSKRIFLASEEALAIDEDRAETSEIAKKSQKKKWLYHVFINPEILKIAAKKESASEGCLSVPGVYGLVPRATKIKVRACDEHGKRFERGASKLFARLLQHEIDHLEGTLFIDKATKLVTIEKK
ncbi:MAG: peptide deformylase [Patescibacteria group bacterium]